MNTGDKIRIFPETDKNAYKDMIHDLGFNCHIKGNFIIVDKRRRLTDEEKRSIGRKITKAMKEQNLSRKDLAERIQVNEATIWGWQLGRFSPSEYNRNLLKKEIGLDL